MSATFHHLARLYNRKQLEIVTSYNSKILVRTIEQAKKGKERARYALYEQYSKAMFNICMRMCKSREDAEDVLQEAFSSAFRNLHTYAHEAAFGAWLKRIVVNRCIDHLNKKKEDWVECKDDLQEADDETIDFSGIELQVQAVHKAIMTLPDGYRIVANLYLLEGYDHQEIADVLNISISTSKSQLLRAKKRIRNVLSTEVCTA